MERAGIFSVVAVRGAFWRDMAVINEPDQPRHEGEGFICSEVLERNMVTTEIRYFIFHVSSVNLAVKIQF